MNGTIVTGGEVLLVRGARSFYINEDHLYLNGDICRRL